MASAYAELHCHTDFSFLDGASSATELVARAVELALAALAITDHGGLAGVVRFVAAARAADLHPVVGLEIELADPTMPDPAGAVVPHRARSGSGGPTRARLRGIADAARGPHLVLLARDALGWRSLCRLVSAANLAGSKGVPRCTQALLREHAEGLVALSGCRDSEIARRLRTGDRAGAAAVARRLAAAFPPVPGLGGAGFVLELEDHLLGPDDDWLAAETAELARSLGLPVVVTNDVHYARRADAELHDVLVAIRHGRTVGDLRELGRTNAEFHLKAGAELAALPAGTEAEPALRRAWAEGLGFAVELAARCRADPNPGRHRFPAVPLPVGETAGAALRRRCVAGLPARYDPVTPAVLRQLEHELGVIEAAGLAEFFLICEDLVGFARSRGIAAQGRGSAGDSVVAYLLGITRVDPIRHGLLFERFINPGRMVFPDVDIDFAADRREEVIRHVYARYGEAHAAMVANVVTYRARSAVRDVGLALGFPRDLVDRAAKALETRDPADVPRELAADPAFASSLRPAGPARHGARPRPAPAGRALADDEGGPGDTPISVAWLGGERGPRPAPSVGGSVASAGTEGRSPWERWMALCARLDGHPRHLSIHSGGMLVSGPPLVDVAPLERATMPGRVVVTWDKRDVEGAGFVKLDLLSLGMLAAIAETVGLIEHDCATCVVLDRLPEEIPEVFAMLCAADTVGVFQVESRAQMQTLPKSRPATLDDLVAQVAIIRPGPIQGGAVHPFLRRRQGIEPVHYLHPSLAPILRDTLGVILYQEQVMRIAIEVAGFSAAESDGFRRAMGAKRSAVEMDRLHRRFSAGCRATSGLSGAEAEELFTQVAAFASFGFAKSHAAAFARTAYESAFLKLFYPAQFLVGLLNAQPMGFYPVEVLVNDAKRHGVAILPVDLNASAYRTTTEWVGPDRGPARVRAPGCIIASASARQRWAAETATGWGVRLGLGLVAGIGPAQADLLDRELAHGPYRNLADVVERTGLPQATIERLIRAGALDSLERPRRELFWQLREVAGVDRRRKGGQGGGRPIDLRLPATAAPALPAPTESERVTDAYAVLGFDSRRQVTELFRPALERLGATPLASLAAHPPGPVRIGGLVVARQHPMTAKGTVFLALEDETGLANVTLWPATWARLRGVVRRHALLLIVGTLQREGDVVNIVAREARPLPGLTGQRLGQRRHDPAIVTCRRRRMSNSAPMTGESAIRDAAKTTLS